MDVTPKLFSDSIEFMAAYIARMRADDNFDTIPGMLNSFSERIFANKDVSLDQLRQLAVYASR